MQDIVVENCIPVVRTTSNFYKRFVFFAKLEPFATASHLNAQ